MKIKEKNDLLNEVRYNPVVNGKHINISKGNPNLDKRTTGALSIFSLMTLSHHYEDLERKMENKDPRAIIEQMMNNAERMVDHTFIKDDNHMGMIR